MFNTISTVSYLKNQNLNFTGRYVPASVSRQYENLVFKGLLRPFMDFRARNIPDKVKASIEPFIERVNIHTNKGKIHAWELNPDDSDKYILFLHGIKGTSYAPPNQLLFETVMKKGGYGIITPEYRGTAELSSQPFNFKSTIEDSRATFEYLYKKGIKPENITIMSHCIGSIGATTIASGENKIGRIIMASPIIDGSGFGTAILKKLHIPFQNFFENGFNRFIDIFMPYDMNITRTISRVESPVLLIVPENDRLVSLKQIEKFAQKVPNLEGIIKVPNAEHRLGSVTCDVIAKNI